MADDGAAHRARVRERRGASLPEAARDLLRSDDLPAALQRIAELARAAAGAEGSCLERIDRSTGEVEVVASAGAVAPPVGTRVPYAGSLAELVVEQDAPEVVDPGETSWPPFATALSERCRRCRVLALPLVSGTHAPGALLLFRPAEAAEFTAEEVARLDLFAELAALAIDRLFLQHEAARRIRELEQSERSFRLLVQGVTDYAIFMLDPEGRVASWNEGAQRIHGYTEEEILGEHFSRFHCEADRVHGHPERELRIAAREGRYQEEGWRLRSDGTRFWAAVAITPIRGEGGELLGFARMTRDLTERRRHEEEREELLRRHGEASERATTVLERITDAFFAVDREWRFTYLNATTREMVEVLLHLDAEQAMGRSFWEVVHQLRDTRFEEEYRRAMATQKPAHFVEFASAFGVWFEVHAYPSPEGLSVYFRDVTQQKRVEQTAELERRRLLAVLDALPVGVFISDADGRVLRANRAAEAIWGGPPPLPDRPEEYGVYRGCWPETGQPVAPGEWPLARALRNGEVVEGEEIEIEAFDGERRTLLVYALPIRDAAGEVMGGVAVNVDITARHRLLREARAARLEAERANRAKSEFLATMSHEIRTPINAITGYADLLAMELAGPLNAAQRHQLERVRASSTHLLGLINEILDLAKVEAGRMSVARSRAVAQHAANEALAMVRPQAAERGVELRNACREVAAITYCGDEDRVRQIVVNLLSNAVKFTPSGGTVTLRCGTAESPDPEARLEGEGPWVYLEVDDTGVGIPPDQLEAVFQPFVQADQSSTRAQGGTGLGLTISRQLARLMGGDLTGRSQPGRGSRFRLWLPRPDLADAASPEHTGGPQRETMVAVGRAVLQQVQPIMARFVERLREDPTFTGTDRLDDTDLQDHGTAFLTDIAQSLLALEESEVDPAQMLRDGGAIQRVISELHGAQRVRLGWGEAQIHREFEILREEVARAVRERVRVASSEELEDGLGALMRCLEGAERISCEAIREAER